MYVSADGSTASGLMCRTGSRGERICVQCEGVVEVGLVPDLVGHDAARRQLGLGRASPKGRHPGLVRDEVQVEDHPGAHVADQHAGVLEPGGGQLEDPARDVPDVDVEQGVVGRVAADSQHELPDARHAEQRQDPFEQRRVAFEHRHRPVLGRDAQEGGGDREGGGIGRDGHRRVRALACLRVGALAGGRSGADGRDCPRCELRATLRVPRSPEAMSATIATPTTTVAGKSRRRRLTEPSPWRLSLADRRTPPHGRRRRTRSPPRGRRRWSPATPQATRA